MPFVQDGCIAYGIITIAHCTAPLSRGSDRERIKPAAVAVNSYASCVNSLDLGYS